MGREVVNSLDPESFAVFELSRHLLCFLSRSGHEVGGSRNEGRDGCNLRRGSLTRALQYSRLPGLGARLERAGNGLERCSRLVVDQRRYCVYGERSMR